MPKISIIVPVYNVEAYLRQCLDNLIHQTLEDIEIICINDESPDHSLEVLNEYAENDSRIKIINQTNTGVSGARNNGLKAAAGEFIMFVDSDDWVDESICQEMYDTIIKEDADSVMCSYCKEYHDHTIVNHIFDENYLVFNEDEVRLKFHRRLFGLIGGELRHPESGDLIVSPGMQLFKADLCKDIEFTDINKIGTFEDGLFQILYYNKCKKLVYIDQPYYHYRKTNENSIITKYKPDLFEKMQNLYDIMYRYIHENRLDDIFVEAMNNRIVLSMIGIGLNEISAADKKINLQSKRLREILQTDRYRTAYTNFNLNLLPFKWKVFFLLCKYRKTVLLIYMLHIINFLRKRI